ncbi:hypothetical protein [Sandarakinorhabdus sp. DWP1-3-1]|uniref:hypothetical protein n=1 Tax=Sandarakinorhabdus sp. DWP1-3-1 TaxID=2804627 RepID=UPI003CEB5E27
MVWVSLAGIIVIVLFARALGFARVPELADEGQAERIAADALHDFRPAEAAVTQDRRGALVAGSDGRVALVRPFGDRWVVRIVNGAATSVDGGTLRLQLPEAMFAPALLDLGPAAAAWARRL